MPALVGQMNLLVDLSDEAEQKVTMGWLYSPVDGGPYDGLVFSLDISFREISNDPQLSDCWQKSGRPFNATTFMDGVVPIEQDIDPDYEDTTNVQNWYIKLSDFNGDLGYRIECPDSGAADPRCLIYLSFSRSQFSEDPQDYDLSTDALRIYESLAFFQVQIYPLDG